jgi:RsiW-degrading membrane proteinase PrsW (M82 family)
MQCRSCGTEIAEKAIVCYRCGTATTDPVRKPAPITTRRGSLVPVVLIVVLILLGMYFGYLSRTAADPEPLQLAAGLCAGGAVAVLLLRIVRRR